MNPHRPQPPRTEAADGAAAAFGSCGRKAVAA
jgi:hypothetical protein